MIYSRGKFYKLTAFKGGLVITDGEDNLKDPTAAPLCKADAGRMLSYLDRFLFEREHGASLNDAHKAALKTAQITNIEAPPHGG
jgi:hypothetical protein